MALGTGGPLKSPFGIEMGLRIKLQGWDESEFSPVVSAQNNHYLVA